FRVGNFRSRENLVRDLFCNRSEIVRLDGAPCNEAAFISSRFDGWRPGTIAETVRSASGKKSDNPNERKAKSCGRSHSLAIPRVNTLRAKGLTNNTCTESEAPF